MSVVLFETVMLPCADAAADAQRGPGVRIDPSRLEVRIRRALSPSSSGRGWWLDLLVTVPVVDPEEVLRESVTFLVDSIDGREIGVVDAIETDEESALVSALYVAPGWPGRRLLRVAVDAIEFLMPDRDRIVVRPPIDGFPELDRPRD